MGIYSLIGTLGCPGMNTLFVHFYFSFFKADGIENGLMVFSISIRIRLPSNMFFFGYDCLLGYFKESYFLHSFFQFICLFTTMSIGMIQFIDRKLFQFFFNHYYPLFL